MDRAVPTNVDGLLEHAGWIRMLAGRLVRDAATADDVVQETWLAALRQQPEHGHSLKPWLARVLRNQAALLVRGERRRRVREEGAARVEDLPSAAELAARAEVQRQLVEAVLELRDPYRSVLLLRYYEGLNPEAIAVRLVVPGSTVRTHLARGLIELRENLERRSGGDRRAWCLALVPLAVEPESSAVGAGLFALLVSNLVAMQVITKFAIAACALAVVVALSYIGCDRDTGESYLSAAMPATAPVVATGVSEREHIGTGTERAPIAVETPIEMVVATQEPTAPTAGGRLKIRLRDKNSRLPVANYTLVVDDGQNDVESLITSADGTVESSREYAAGELAITLLDCERTQSLSFYDGGLAKAWPPQIERVSWKLGEEIELEVAIGPTLTVSLSSRSTMRDGDWFGAVYSGSPCEHNGNLGCERAPLRTGATTWMRCAAQAIGHVSRGYDVTLIVSSADGLMAGSVNTPGFGDVAVELNPTGRLDLELARNDKRSIEAPQVELRALKGGCVRRADSRWNGSDVIDDAHARNFTFGALEPGEYEITASCSDCVSDKKRVRLSGGRITRFTMVLAASAGKARLRGELRSISTTFATPVIVRATPMTWPQERALTQRCEFQNEGGALVARFEFNGLQPRKYQLQVIPTDNEHPRWTPQSIVVAAPNEELVFTCRDDEPRVNLHLRVLDADTDDPLDKAKWEYTLDGVEMTSNGEELVIQSVSTESRFEWNVTSRGYGITGGNWKQIWHAGRESFGEVRLQRGWGAKVRVVNEWSRVPLADAAIFVDREEAGHTDASGVLLVDRRRIPRWIGAKLEGWEQVDDMRKLGVVIDDGVHNVLVLPMREMR